MLNDKAKSEISIEAKDYTCRANWIVESALVDPKFNELREVWNLGANKDKVAAESNQLPHINVVGPIENHAAFILSALLLQKADNDFAFVVASDLLQSRRLQEALKAFYPGEVLEFPAREFNLSQIESASKNEMHQRIKVISRLLETREEELRPIVLITAAALQQRMPILSNLLDKYIKIDLNTIMEPAELAAKLSNIGYKYSEVAENAGEFSQRGDIVDLVPINADESGIRISFFDNEIEQIKLYDLESQRQYDEVNEIFISPAQEINISSEERAALVDKIKDFRDEQSKNMYKKAANRDEVEAFKALCNYDIERLENNLSVEILDRWMEYIYPEKTSILDYFQELCGRAVVFELKKLQESLDAWQAGKEQQIKQLLVQGKTTNLVAENIIGKVGIMKSLDQNFQVLSFALLDGSGNGFPTAKKFAFRSLAAENYRAREDEFYEMLKERQADEQYTYIYVADPSKRDALNEKLLLNVPATVKRLVPRALNEGFVWPDARLAIFGTENVFGKRYRRNKRRKKNEQTIKFFSDLEIGSYVVHEDHGIGLYEGIETLTTASGSKDYIKVSYAKGDSLFLPMEAIEQLSKYVGMDNRKPRLSSLGGGEWSKLKTRARDSIKKLATNIVKLYAERNRIKGYKFSVDTVWDNEFAEEFPFEETDDQLEAMEDVREDMQSDKVMDRLLIGDVGFGKTEVAFRAMFKAVSNGMQAAMLSPTTVLTQQHYENFKERAKGYPIEVAVLSRFTSKKEQQEIVKDLKNGMVDVVIGTHRLLSDDVEFKRLGVLVVDEEQRFGVDHKEKLKEKYPNVDVLSLSATPIPRTLHMSLSGIRDISLLEEPPQERREIQTFVLEYDEAIINEAIIREVGRGGQVFYLINNVKKIPEIAKHLEEKIPGLRVAIGHGQMPEAQLEGVIHSFIKGEADVLVCTTIIESGIDMPNVNTLIARDADRLGLAQLYQIKGRVGRSNKQAYAFITYDGNKTLTEDAQKRLATIRDFTELGSGMKIAMRDLEVRGAGNLLGGEQHGHMEAIGYELYVQMLEEEVQLAREEAVEEEKAAADSVDVGSGVTDVETASSSSVEHSGVLSENMSLDKDFVTRIDIKLDAYLPSSLIPSEGQRMDMYKRLLDIEDIDEYYDILDELMDRYGELPEETYALADISYVESQARKLHLSRVYIDRKDIVLEFSPELRPNMEALGVLLNLEKYKHKIKFIASGAGNIRWGGAAKNKKLVSANLRELFKDLEMAIREQQDKSAK